MPIQAVPCQLLPYQVQLVNSRPMFPSLLQAKLVQYGAEQILDFMNSMKVKLNSNGASKVSDA